MGAPGRAPTSAGPVTRGRDDRRDVRTEEAAARRVHRGARLLERVLGRPARPRRGLLRGVHAVLVGAVASGPLDPKIKEFVYIAVDAAATHLYVPGIRQHVKQALAHGATAEEIMEVLELTATLGIHACNIGVPILVEELEASRAAGLARALRAQEEIKAEFAEKRGYWNPFWDEMLWLDPEFFAAYTQFSSVPWVSGRARAEGQGADLHRLRRVGDAPVRLGPAPAHPQRARLRRHARGGARGDRARERDRHPLLHGRRADPGRGARRRRLRRHDVAADGARPRARAARRSTRARRR